MTAPPLKTKLEAACKDLWWSSEADYPVEVLWHELPALQRLDPQALTATATEAALSPAVLDPVLICSLAGCAEDTAITARPFDSFFASYLIPKGWHTGEDKQQLKQLDQLQTLLATSLIQPQVYRCGDVEITLLIVGYASDSIVAGVKTCLVET